MVSPGENEEQNGHPQVCGGHIDPYVDGERLQESEERCLFFDRLAEEDADTCEWSKHMPKMIRSWNHSTNCYTFCKLPVSYGPDMRHEHGAETSLRS